MTFKEISLIILASALTSTTTDKANASEIIETKNIVHPKYYTDHEIQKGRLLALSNTTLNEHLSENHNIWFSLTEEAYTYKELNHKKYVVTRLEWRYCLISVYR